MDVLSAGLPHGLEERYRDLRRRPKLRAELRAGREAAVERVVFGTGRALWMPEVPLDPPRNELPPRVVDEPGPHDLLAGLDASGRAVLVRGAFGLHGEPPAAVLAHPSESGEMRVIHVRLLTWDGPRLEIVGFLTHRDVSHVTWVDHDEDGRPVRFATAGVPYNDLGKGAEVATCEWEGDRCVRVVRTTAEGSESVAEGEYDEHGLVRVRAGERVRWDRAEDGYDDDPLPPPEALDAWVEAVAEATARVMDGVDAAAVKVSPAFAHDYAPTLVIVERGYLQAAAARVGARQALLELEEPRHDLLPHFGARGLRALRSLRQQRVDEDQPAAAAALARLLRERLAVPALVAGLAPLDWDLSALGELPVPAPVPKVERAPASEGELEGLLRAFDLPPDLVRQAQWGYALVGGGRGASRLGGPAELPAGMPWPTCEGRALTHLATIALDEVGDERLPGEGTLVLFADLTEEGALWDEVVVGEDDRVRVVHVPPGTPTHEPAPPRDDRDEYDSPAVLRRRGVAFRRVLTLPERPEGLDDAAKLGYEQLHSALVEVTPGLADPGHLLLGHPAVVQWDPREPGHVSLLHLGWDEALRFEFLDGGDLTFYGDAEDVRAGRWERLRVSPESC